MSEPAKITTERPEIDRSRGSVTAEFAVLLPGLALLLAVVLAAASAGVAQMRCVDGARSAARLAARHESPSAVLAAGRAAGPAGSSVRVSASGDLVRVEVRATVPLPLPGRPTVAVAATSVAPIEGSADPDSSAASATAGLR